MARPRKDSPEVKAAICERLANGESLAAICRDSTMPSVYTVMGWLREDDVFSQDYARSREYQAEHYAARIADIGDRTLNGEYDPQAARVAVDALKWTAGKMLPKKYGDKLDVKHEGGISITVATGVPDAD